MVMISSQNQGSSRADSMMPGSLVDCTTTPGCLWGSLGPLESLGALRLCGSSLNFRCSRCFRAVRACRGFRVCRIR
eukprot:2344917-Alexandrium_andersonii.AAC.1